MPLKTIIKEKRKEIGLTQEQVADYLGVSTPAVNKWENGITYPDVTLLSPLARLLKTDLNTLLCFHEELTQQEIQHFSKDVFEKVQQEGFENGLKLAKQKIAEYPKNATLIHDLALILDGAMLLTGMTEEEKKVYEKDMDSLYEQISNCDDLEIRNSTNFMLASKYINRGDLEKASHLIDQLPEPSPINKNMLTANLLEKQGKLDEAKEIHERLLLMKVTEVWNHLLTLSNLAFKSNQLETAQKLTSITRECAKLFEFSEYYQQIPLLQIAVHKQDANASISILKELFIFMKTPWNITDSPLYEHIQMQASAVNNMAQIMPAIISEIASNPDYEFLRGSKEYEELMKNVG